MAELGKKTVDSGFVPGRALTQDQYSSGFVDFYKDYLNLTGVNVRDPKDDDDDDDKDDYVAPQIIPTDDGSGQETNLLSSQLSTGLTGRVTGVTGNYYDAKVKAADLQSMDLTSKSWQDYKKASGLADKSSLTRDAQITGVGLALAGTSGAMIGGAVLGKPVNAPWGIENPGAGMFNAIGNYAISQKYSATQEVVAAQAAFADPDGSLGVAGEIFEGQDVGHAFYVDDTYLVRRPGTTQYIGTLPSGLTNQQVLNLEAIKNNRLPNYQGGIGTEKGFGIGGEGGYNYRGSFVDANGVIAAYGSMSALNTLAEKDFNGNKQKAEKWLTEVRSYRNLFGSTITEEQANQIKDRINGESVTTTSKPFGADVNRFGRGVTQFGTTSGETSATNIIDPGRGGSTEFRDTDRIFTGRTDELDSVYTGPGSLASDRAVRESGIDQGEPTPTTDKRTGYGQALTSSLDSRFQQQRDVRMAEREKKDAALANTYSFSDDDYRDMSEGSQTADEVTVDERSEDEKGQKSQDYSMTFADDAASSDTGGGKIVCTMMNQSYGFGSFRNAIWLKYSKDKLSEEYQTGYHRIFLPLVAYAKNKGVSNTIVRHALEHIAKHRTLDLRQEMRGAKRHTLGRFYRSILEPVCYIVGKI